MPLPMLVAGLDPLLPSLNTPVDRPSHHPHGYRTTPRHDSSVHRWLTEVTHIFFSSGSQLCVFFLSRSNSFFDCPLSNVQLVRPRLYVVVKALFLARRTLANELNSSTYGSSSRLFLSSQTSPAHPREVWWKADPSSCWDV